MSRRLALLAPVLWVSIAACSAPAGPDPVKTAAAPAPAPAPPPTPTPPTPPTPPVADAAPPALPDLPPPPDGPRPVTRGWTSYEDGDHWGFKDATGKVVLPARYDLAQDFTPGGIACVIDGANGWVCIDGNGHPLVRPFLFDNGPDYFSEGLARFVERGKLGFFDDTGARKIPARFDHVLPFEGDRAAFCDGCKQECEPGGEHCRMAGGKWGLIDKTGNEVVPASFDDIGPFEGGTARALKDGAELTIDRDGNPVVPGARKTKKTKKGG